MNKRTALKKAIEHHENNLNALCVLEGEFKHPEGKNFFAIGGIYIYFTDKECPLCQKYGSSCTGCPLGEKNKKYNCERPNSPWHKLDKAETIQEAIRAEINMVKVIKKVLRGKKK